MDETESVQGPSKLKYIGVYVLFAISQYVLSSILGLILVDNFLSGPEDLNTFFIIANVLQVPIYAGAFILIYNQFKSLNIKKVMIYIYILGTLGVFYNIGSVGEQLQIPNDANGTLVWSTILSFVVSCVLIRTYYLDKSDRWY